MAQKFRILCIDGGGLRGVIPVLILQELERRMNGKRIHEMFDLIAGTSTGGLITCGLAVADGNNKPLYNLDNILSIYTNRGKEIFPKKGFFGNLVTKVSSLTNPTYSAAGIDKVLRDLVDHKRIMNCVKPIFVTSYDLYNNEDIFFRTRTAAKDATCNVELYDVCRATSAGPTYLPAYLGTFGNSKRAYIDGGVYMNNPTVGAIVEVSKFHADPIYNRPDLKFEDICVLSLGTGHYSADLAQKKVEGGGALNWVKPISDIMMQGVNQATSYEAEELLEDGQYLRLSINIYDEKRADMADSSDETRDYLIAETKNQVLNNSVLMKQLDDFIKTAQL